MAGWTVSIKKKDGSRRNPGRIFKNEGEALRCEYELKQACPELEPKAEKVEGNSPHQSAGG